MLRDFFLHKVAQVCFCLAWIADNEFRFWHERGWRLHRHLIARKAKRAREQAPF